MSTLTAEELATLKARHKKRVERRAKYLARLTLKQRLIRDRYVAWMFKWRVEYHTIVRMITANKQFIRSPNHNNLYTLKSAMKRLEEQKFKARTLMFARTAAKQAYQAFEDSQKPE